MLTLASPVIVANVCLSLCIASSALLMLLQRELFPFSALSLRRVGFHDPFVLLYLRISSSYWLVENAGKMFNPCSIGWCACYRCLPSRSSKHQTSWTSCGAVKGQGSPWTPPIWLHHRVEVHVLRLRTTYLQLHGERKLQEESWTRNHPLRCISTHFEHLWKHLSRLPGQVGISYSPASCLCVRVCLSVYLCALIWHILYIYIERERIREI